MIKSIFIILFVASMTFATESSYTEKSTYVEVMLDASNYRFYTFDLTETTTFDYTQPGTFWEDTIISKNSLDTTGNRYRAWARLGSETGEPLFIRFRQSATNKEHMTHAGAEMHLAHDHLQLRGGYHHLGSFSDRVDSLFRRLNRSYGYAPKHKDTGDYGISEYYFGVWKLSLANVHARGIIRKYGNWILTPVTYDPVYFSGYRYHQELSLTGLSDTLRLHADFDMRRRYLNHIDASKLNILTGSASWTHRFSEKVLTDFTIEGNTETDAEVLMKANLAFLRNTNKSIWFETGVWSNFEPIGEVGFSWPVDSSITLSSSVKSVYAPGQKGYTYLNYKDTVKLDRKPIRETKMETEVSYRPFYKLPFSLKGWLLLQKGAPKYSVVGNSGRIEVTTNQSKDFIAAAGGRIVAGLAPKNASFFINPWVQGNYFLTGQLPEVIPYEAGCEIGLLTGDNKMNRYALSLTYRSPYTVSINETGETHKHKSKQLLFLNLSISAPFVSPLFSDRLKPSIKIEAGPIHLLHGTREVFHPFGSEFGPAIFAEVVVDVM